MGGRGTYSLGKSPNLEFETVGKIYGGAKLGNIKIIEPKSKNRKLKLPEESKTSDKYVLFDKNGIFHQYREYNSQHLVVFELGYHKEKSSGGEAILHAHFYDNPGVENHRSARRVIVHKNDEIYKKYNKILKGVENERL